MPPWRGTFCPLPLACQYLCGDMVERHFASIETEGCTSSSSAVRCTSGRTSRCGCAAARAGPAGPGTFSEWRRVRGVILRITHRGVLGVQCSKRPFGFRPVICPPSLPGTVGADPPSFQCPVIGTPTYLALFQSDAAKKGSFFDGRYSRQ